LVIGSEEASTHHVGEEFFDKNEVGTVRKMGLP
jgi:hypothetical protein